MWRKTLIVEEAAGREVNVGWVLGYLVDIMCFGHVSRSGYLEGEAIADG